MSIGTLSSEVFYIDTIDARAGFAFISLRDPLSKDANTLPDAPCFYVAPPDFLPFPVIDRALAMAASHHGFQVAVADADGEVPFEELEDAIDFVKRCYIRGAASDGDGGDGPSIPPLPGGEPTPPFEPPSAGIEEVTSFGKIVEMLNSSAHQVSVQHIKRGQSQLLKWELNAEFWTQAPQKPTLSWPAGGNITVQAWLQLVFEVFARLPRGAPVGQPQALAQSDFTVWRKALLAVLELATCSGLWPYLNGSVWAKLDHLAAEVLTKNQFQELHNVARRIPPHLAGSKFATICHVFLHPGALDLHTSRWLYGVPIEGLAPIVSMRAVAEDGRFRDPWEQLGSVPVPRQIALAAAIEPLDGTSLADVIAAILSDPKLLADDRLCAFAVLCSHRIVAGSERLLSASILGQSDFWTGSRLQPRTSIYLAVQYDLSEKAALWLQENLSTRVFSAGVEEIIRSANALHRAL